MHKPSERQKDKILSAISKIASDNGIQIEACAENDYTKYGILPSKCINGGIFERLLTEKYKDLDIQVKRKNNKLDGQRKNCLCMPSVDIGQYDTCFHDCKYCYAKKSFQKSMKDKPVGTIYKRKTELEFVYK